jgi:hypothetical protein
LLIKITQDNIDKGVRTSPCRCPMALGIKESIGAYKVCVGAEEADINGKFDIPLPQIARDFIRKYDCREQVEPFEFEWEELRSAN